MLVVVASELYYNKRIGMVTYDPLAFILESRPLPKDATGPMTVSLSV
jgi:hypothetical protein